MDAYAKVLAKANQSIRRWDRRHHFYGLDPGEAKDIRQYARYTTLTRRRRNYSNREVIAARHYEFEEINRLFGLEQRTKNKRTDLTADMGLRYCGA
jgi:hypothetical protein